ncbi:MAG: hypothetical protein ACK56W_22435 [Pirellula sp.]
MKKLTLIPCIGLVFLLGCDSPAPNQTMPSPFSAAENSSSNVEDLPLIDRAEYVNWSQFPQGTVVKLVRETKSESDKVVVITTAKLASKSDKKVVVETQITVDRGGEPLVNPVIDMEFLARVRLPPNMEAAKFALPSQDAKEEGKETVEFKGMKYDATIYTWDAASEVGKTKNKMWMCNEIPGRVLRHEMSCSTFSTSENITEIEIPNS